MVLAPLPLATRVFNRFLAEHVEHHSHRHEQRHLAVVHTHPVTALRRGVTTHVLRSHTVERPTPTVRGPGAAALDLVVAPARAPRTAPAPLPEAAAAVRALVEQVSGSHRRIDSPAPRLHARAIRDEEPDLPPAATRALRAVPPTAAAPAPAMVLSRQAAATAQAAAQAAVAAATGPPVRELVSPHHSAPPPLVDVESLTDRVVDQIDRRVNAQRERHGIF
jgi:hypothetical protein